MSCSGKIKVLLVRPNELPSVVEIPNTLNSMHKLINGKFEVSYLLDDADVCVISNSESPCRDKFANRIINNSIMYNDFIVIGNDLENGDFKSLTGKQIEKYQNRFNNDSILKTKNRIAARKLAEALLYRRS